MKPLMEIPHGEMIKFFMENQFGFGLSNPTKFSMDFPWDSKQFYLAKTYRFFMEI